MGAEALDRLRDEVVDCRACPRLVEWRERVAVERRRAYADWTYWGRPVPGFGDPEARLLVFGLAPAAHGANRTGRMFTGDRSGDWLFAAMHRTGFASQPTSEHVDDGLRLIDAYVTAGVRCAPPDNRPLPEERDRCAEWTHRELPLLRRLRVAVALGAFGWEQLLRALGAGGAAIPSPRPRFGHRAVVDLGAVTVIGSYHPSQQNTFTGRLTREMLDAVFLDARRLLDG